MSKLPDETSILACQGRLLVALKSIALEVPDALDRTAALAIQAHADDDLAMAAAAAGLVVLAEHLQAGMYKHAMRMIGVLAEVGPDVASGNEGLLAWAGAAIAHDYGVLPSWPAANLAWLMELAMAAPADYGLALACSLGEVCERNGQDAEFAAIQAQVAAIEVSPDASAFWQGHWSIVCAWHLCAFAKVDEARFRFEKAQALAAWQVWQHTPLCSVRVWLNGVMIPRPRWFWQRKPLPAEIRRERHCGLPIWPMCTAALRCVFPIFMPLWVTPAGPLVTCNSARSGRVTR
jgi:hypothetical protein